MRPQQSSVVFTTESSFPVISTQVNGGGGVLFNHSPSAAIVETMALAHLRFGTTSMLPTIITDNASTMAQAADAIAEVMEGGPECIKALIKGIHFEGPFLSKAKKGVHEAQFIRTPSDAELATLCRKDIGKVLLTVAPEAQRVLGFHKKAMVAEGVVVAFGTPMPAGEQVQAAIDAGATGFTRICTTL